jgi:hypothetical protein
VEKKKINKQMPNTFSTKKNTSKHISKYKEKKPNKIKTCNQIHKNMQQNTSSTNKIQKK